MPLAGTQVQPREIAQLSAEAFARHGVAVEAVTLVESVAVCLAESLGFDRAWHDNDNDSRDVGLWQIDILGAEIGTQAEADLYDPAKNADAMVKLHVARGWEPWVSFTATTYLYDSFVGRAARGVGNYLAGLLLERPAHHLDGTPVVHSWQQPLLDYEFRLADAAAGILAAERALGWKARTALEVTAIHRQLAAALAATKAATP